jgi:predicted phage terminase large subunit-like protein
MFDELCHFTEAQFFYLLSRMRSMSGMRPTMRGTCNPDPDSFVRRLLDWWIDEKTGLAIPERSGVIRWMLRDGDAIHWADTRKELRERYPHLTRKPLSFTFIPSKLSDNPALLSVDPDYRARLEMLSRIERERLLGGNWNIRAAGGNVFKRDWFEIIDRLPDDVERTTRGWDLAASEPSEQNRDPDFTRGVKVSKHKSGLYVVQDVRSLRGRAHAVDELLMSTARGDGRNVTQAMWTDPGSAGKSLSDHHVRMLAGYDVRMERASKDKLTYAKPVSAQAEHGNIKLMRGPWNEEFLRELEAFDGEGRSHDDICDGLSRAFLDLTTAVPMKSVHFRNL